MTATARKPSVLMVGAGEYNAGYVPTVHGAASDKPAGVVALTLLDLRRRGLVDRIALADIRGTHMPAVRENLRRKISDVYTELDTSIIECFPEDHVEHDPGAVTRAISSMSEGDCVIIFTPDDTHAEITAAALRARLHVLVAKPLVKSLAQHHHLLREAEAHKRLLCVEYHKRFDPMYMDAWCRAQALGPFSYFYSYMAQPKQQLDTFAAWAGKASDISFYLNSHHIDICNWLVGGAAIPVTVTAMASTGVAEAKLGRPCQDTITLLTQWQDVASGALGTAVFTASWVTPKADAHTQQHLHYMGQAGELRVDQAHRGYTDSGGFASYNPLYMRYTPDRRGMFAGQTGYGYISIERFITAAADVNTGTRSVSDIQAEGALAVAAATLPVTGILEAGRLSLDSGGKPVRIVYSESPSAPGGQLPVRVELAA